jgi:hypothetical protein
MGRTSEKSTIVNHHSAHNKDDILLLDQIRRRGGEEVYDDDTNDFLLTGRPYEAVCSPLLPLAESKGRSFEAKKSGVLPVRPLLPTVLLRKRTKPSHQPSTNVQ